MVLSILIMAPVQFASLCFKDTIKNTNDATNYIKQLEKERSEFFQYEHE